MQKKIANEIVSMDSETVSGAPVFTGSRVFLRNLADYIIGGETIATFLDDFPSVTREQVEGFLYASLNSYIQEVKSQAEPHATPS